VEHILEQLLSNNENSTLVYFL